MERNVVGNAEKMSDTKNAVDGVDADKGSLENVIKKLNNIEAKLGRGMHRRRNHRSNKEMQYKIVFKGVDLDKILATTVN